MIVKNEAKIIDRCVNEMVYAAQAMDELATAAHNTGRHEEAVIGDAGETCLVPGRR